MKIDPTRVGLGILVAALVGLAVADCWSGRNDGREDPMTRCQLIALEE